MRKKALLGLAVLAALALIAGCKKVYMVPTPHGWSEMKMSKDGDEIKIKPAEKMEVEYDY